MFNGNHQFLMRRSVGVAVSLFVLVALMSLRVAQAAQPETVTNPLTIANPVRSVAVANPEPSRQAYSATFSQSSSTTALNVSFGTVPAGKRLVIENESLTCYTDSVGSILYAYLVTNLGRTYLLLQKMYSDGGSLIYYAGTFTSTLYADPNGLGTGDITFVLQASPVTTALHCDGAIVGHNVASPVR